jgi:hypothetical protein
VKHGTVFVFTLIVVGVFSWAHFGDAPLETKLERLFTLTSIYLCGVFANAWYTSKNLSDRIDKLERSAAERESAMNPQISSRG